MSVGWGIFRKILQILKNNKCQWDKVSFLQDLQVLYMNKCQWDIASFQHNVQILKK